MSAFFLNFFNGVAVLSLIYEELFIVLFILRDKW